MYLIGNTRGLFPGVVGTVSMEDSSIVTTLNANTAKKTEDIYFMSSSSP